ncbi:LysR family transcriptional regulator [Rhizobium rhizogenes]|uniref:LysR family transcriptional regulator n=1 Tax=Rhizobium rhizogenes TaxID=359 RepID=UPI001571EEB1|nr:LysR family transcriptional regulator [Rhizobium rhizogenes]NTF47081.1 LysR family transcriptional regulator [Rhizobium rhizogenes]
MPKHLVDFRLFQYALTSAEQGSFRQAAATLNIQQSTVSRGVRNLEHRVGAALFERDHSGIRPTPAGDQFLKEATLGFDHLKRALERAEALQRGDHGELTVGVSVPFAMLGTLFERFRAGHGGVSVEIVEETSDGCRSLVQQRQVDVAFVTKVTGNGTPQSLYLRDERMTLVLPKSHPLAGAGRLKLEELRRERFVLGASGVGPDLEQHLRKRMAKWGVQPRVQLHRAGLCNLINMVALGLGVTIVIGPPPRVAANDVVLVPLAGRNIVPVSAVWMESNPNPALKGLLDIVREHASVSRVTQL